MFPRIAVLGCAVLLLANGSVRAGTPAEIDWNLTPDQLAETCTARINAALGRVEAIGRVTGRRTFTNTILPLEDAFADANDTLVAQRFLSEVSTQKAVRDASLACNTKVDDAFAMLTAQPALFRAVAAAARSGTARTIYDRKLTELWLVRLKRSGAALPAKNRAEFVRLERHLNDLQSRFEENLAQDATTITIAPEQTAGVPADLLATYARAPGGGYIVPVNESTVSFLQLVPDEAARKAYFLAYGNRQAVANTALLREAIAARDRLAHLLGFETWADFQLSDKMAQSPARVMKFLQNLDTAILPKAREEIATLHDLQTAQLHDPHAILEPWDVPREQYLLKKQRYAVDMQLVRQYFPVQHTIDAVLNVYHTLLGVTFERLAPVDAWAPGVLVYQVNDTADGRLIGYTFFDLYPRPGKYAHFASFSLLPARSIEGALRPPVAAIVGNWPRPAPGEPALLSHADVVIFFHEFGHDMAALLATAPYETLSEGFRRDFVEAPSQMLENFAWQPSILRHISSNWKTGEPLPDDLITKMIDARFADYAYDTTRQILYAMADMAYHSSGPHVDTTAVWQTLSQRETPVPMYPGTHPQASFGHIMGGYDAGYYGYLWSKVYAADLFTAFESGGLENPSVGMRYRTDILAPARTLEPDVEVRDFLGRPMNPQAFYEQFGPAVGTAPR
ncbi:MAG: M3 family metallopeptidase [Vulcanimicrobiaceae bacterium]